MTKKKRQAPEASYYEVLGLTRKFTTTQLRDNWRALSRQLHPDRTGDQSPEAADVFAAVSRAYATLADPALRRAYDARLDLLTSPCGICGGAGETYKQKGFAGRVATPCSTCSGTGRRHANR